MTKRKTMNFITGWLESHERGFAFCMPEEGQDIFIAKENRNGAMHRDRVKVRLIQPSSPDRKAEGEVVKVLERNVRPIVGTFHQAKGYGFVTPDDPRYGTDIYIGASLKKGAQNKDKVAAVIEFWPKRHDKNPQGRIVDVIGHHKAKGIEISSLAYQFNLPTEFSARALREAERLPDRVEAIGDRIDYRSLLTVTIDGADAKDFDDAISIQKTETGHRLWVHIADVSHYVKKGSAIDKEAYERGTSVYLLDRVIPMLPEALSNGICSLNPHVDRLTVTCRMDVDQGGQVRAYAFEASAIRSDHRLVYTDVSDQLEGIRDVYDDPDLIEMLETCQDLFQILYTKRHERGAIDFDFPERKITLDKDGRPIDIRPEERRVANRIIEEFMVLANETVAVHFHKKKVPFFYRVHEDPAVQKIMALENILRNFGIHLQEGVSPKALQGVVEAVQGKEEARVVETMLLRSLSKARYTPETLAHFGLATDHYTHFTSPIRRYPDLIVHRIIRDEWNGKVHSKSDLVFQKYLAEAGEHTSIMERNAEEAERTAEDLMACIYMDQFVGSVFDGVVSGVTNFGIFVELDNTVEGLVAYRDMNKDFYVYDEVNMRAVGTDTGKTIALGDKVRVRVAGVNMDRNEINFIFAER